MTTMCKMCMCVYIYSVIDLDLFSSKETLIKPDLICFVILCVCDFVILKGIRLIDNVS